MTPILGILASGISGNLWQPGKDFDSIATVTPYTTTTTVVFSSIPSTYRHLQIRGFAATTGVANNTNIRFNGDTGGNYFYHYLSASGASVVAGGVANITSIDSAIIANSSGAFTGVIIDILDYKDTNKYKTVRSLSGVDLNGSNTWLELKSGAWSNTAAVNSITITSPGNAFNSNSHWALYGIK
jgi:hypothetical protein